MKSLVFLGIGTNLGNRSENLRECIKQIHQSVGSVKKISSVYETEPWGVEEQTNYYNQVLKVETELKPFQLLIKTQAIENKMGRIRKEKWGSRIIDIDILFYDQKIIISKKLNIPHPLILNRNFVLEPLVEIEPDYIHPVKLQNINSLIKQSDDKSWIKKLE